MPVRLERLKLRPQFLAAAAARKKWVAPGFVLQARRREPEEAHPPRRPADPAAVRVGFTASRKVGGAVERNRAKRRLRAAADRVLTDRAAPGWDLVLIARASTLDRPFDEIVADLARGLDRLGAGRPGAERPRRTASAAQAAAQAAEQAARHGDAGGDRAAAPGGAPARAAAG